MFLSISIFPRIRLKQLSNSLTGAQQNNIRLSKTGALKIRPSVDIYCIGEKGKTLQPSTHRYSNIYCENIFLIRIGLTRLNKQAIVPIEKKRLSERATKSLRFLLWSNENGARQKLKRERLKLKFRPTRSGIAGNR